MAIGKRDTHGYWAVNGTPLIVPTEVTVEHENIVTPDSGRMESGLMHVTFVRGDVRKVCLTWDRLTGAETEYLKDLMQGKVFSFTYYDNGVQSMDGYVGKSSYGQKNLGAYTDEGGLCENIKIDVVEM